MTIPTYSTPFTDDVSTVSADFLNNYVRTQLPKALDGVGGSVGVASTPATKIEIAGAGLELNGSGTAGRLQYGSRSATRVQSGPIENRNAGTFHYISAAIAAGQAAYQHLDRLPDDSVLTAVTIYFLRTPTGILPGTRVQVALFKTDVTTGTETTVVADTQDPTATIGPYETHHGVTLSVGGTETIDSTKYIYYVRVKGELAGNTSTITLYSATATYTITQQDEAP